MNVTIGGDRVGSGKKMQAHLHNYFRSTHNLSEKFASSMASGVLYPCLCKLAMRGDSFDIKIDADCRTIPTIGPLFGSYKFQVDVYQIPVRLYQGILHNNPLAIGLKMNQVKFPTLEIQSTVDAGGVQGAQMNYSSLIKYLGLSGLGKSAQDQSSSLIKRKVNAIPMLAYYDICKNYYANKQEDDAYIISVTEEEIYTDVTKVTYTNFWYQQNEQIYTDFEDVPNEEGYKWTAQNILLATDTTGTIKIEGQNLNDLTVYIYTYNYEDEEWTNESLYYLTHNNYATINSKDDNGTNITFTLSETWINTHPTIRIAVETGNSQDYVQKLKLTPFKLSNIDDMRYDLLCSNTLGADFIIGDSQKGDYLPYSAIFEKDSNGKSFNTYPMNGLFLKTYQNDIFNNWLNAEWIEGENGINELSKVSITDGAFSMDALSFAEKLYNMLNRVAISGNTYEDWQDAVYEAVKRRQIESPIFVGGMSKEVVFDEIVQTAPANVGGEESTLGTLGGRGRFKDYSQKGGTIHVKCDEACFIIAIASLTPRIYYSQGNEFYLTDIETMDDLHKPAMDGIGFQDLIGERMAWWDTTIAPNSSTVLSRSKIGKLPAWMEYMTSFDKSYGDFAGEYGFGYMVLNRNYEHDEETRGIKDATTYVDPSKYNYAFAYKDLDAQNFWVQINFDIKARRLMSARLIPNV